MHYIVYNNNMHSTHICIASDFKVTYAINKTGFKQLRFSKGVAQNVQYAKCAVFVSVLRLFFD